MSESKKKTKQVVRRAPQGVTPKAPALTGYEKNPAAVRRQVKIILLIFLVLGAVYGVWGWGEDSGWGNPDRAVKMKLDAASQAFLNRDLNGAVSIYERLLKKYPQHSQASQALTQLAGAYEELGLWSLAEGAYGRLMLELEKDNTKRDLRAYTLLQVAKIKDKQGQSSEAARLFQRVRDEHPKTDWAGEALSGLGELRMGQRDYKAATEVYRRLIKEMPGGFLAAEAQSQIGACLEAQNKLAEAVLAYQVVIDRYPSAVWDNAKARIEALKARLHAPKKGK